MKQQDNIFILNTNIKWKKMSKVEHPKHYNRGIEMWDYAYSHNLDCFEGNILKYFTRWRYKNGIEDLLKAKQYLDKLIENEKEWVKEFTTK